MSARTIVEVDPKGPDALLLLRQAAIEARELYPELFDADAPWPSNPPTPEGGTYLVVYESEMPIACGSLRPIDEKVAEVRRMFVTPSARGTGAAKAMLQALERHAARLGYTHLRLETGYRQTPAMRLYESSGFLRIPPFGVYLNDPTSVCYEKAIDKAHAGES